MEIQIGGAVDVAGTGRIALYYGFHKSSPGSGIQYLKKEVILDICLKKCFYEAQNIYPLFEKPRENG